MLAKIGERHSFQLPTGRLAPREIELLSLIGEGRKSKEIAQEMHIASQTVKNHVEHILVKLDATNRPHALMIAIKRGDINPSR